MLEKSSINLFIVTTSAQALHVRRIIKQYQIERSIVISRVIIDSDYFPENVELQDVSAGYPAVFFKWRSIKEKISQDKVHLHAPHMLNIFAQDIFHNIKSNGNLLSFNIIPDGNLLFNGYKLKRSDRLNLARKVFSILLKSRYILIEGSIVSPFVKIDTLYSYVYNVNIQCQKIQLIDVVTQDSKTPSVGSWLILGHRNQSALDANRLAKCVKSVAQCDNLFFKPHPGVRVSDDLFLKELRKAHANVQILENRDPIEKLFNNLNVGNVFAVASSSLITLKLEFPIINFYHCGSKEYLQGHYDEVLGENFKRLGLIEVEY